MCAEQLKDGDKIKILKVNGWQSDPIYNIEIGKIYTVHKHSSLYIKTTTYPNGVHFSDYDFEFKLMPKQTWKERLQ